MLALKQSRYFSSVCTPARFRAAPAARLRFQQPVRAADPDLASYTLKPIQPGISFDAERLWLSTAITTWLNEEWTVLPEHDSLGQAAAEAYVTLRRQGEDDMGSIVLGVGQQLLRQELAAAFRASFTDPFEVANKVSEMVMMRDGCDVCCTTAQDRERLQRVDALLSGSGSSGSGSSAGDA